LNARPRFVVTFEATPDSDGLISLKRMLKVALRRFGLRCVRLAIVPSAEEVAPPDRPAAPSSTDRRETTDD
jgi:hypothetical protein